MEALAYLAPIAFIFAVAALTKANALEKEVKALKRKDEKERQSRQNRRS